MYEQFSNISDLRRETFTIFAGFDKESLHGLPCSPIFVFMDRFPLYFIIMLEPY